MLTVVIGGIRIKIIIGLIAWFLNIDTDQRPSDFGEKVRLFWAPFLTPSTWIFLISSPSFPYFTSLIQSTPPPPPPPTPPSVTILPSPLIFPLPSLKFLVVICHCCCDSKVERGWSGHCCRLFPSSTFILILIPPSCNLKISNTYINKKQW